MKIPKGLLKGITVFLLLGLIAFVAYVKIIPELREFKKEEPEMAEKREPVKKSEITVTAGQVIIGPLIKRINGAGLAQPYRQIPVRARTTGEILSLNVKEGQWVREGALLFVVDSTERYLTFKEREAQLQASTVRYILESGVDSENVGGNSKNLGNQLEGFIAKSEREWLEADNLLKTGTINKTEYDERKQNYEIASVLSGVNADDVRLSQWNITTQRNAYERAKYELENTKVFAPLTGAVAFLSIQQGQQIGNSEALHILDDRIIRVVINVLEPEVADLMTGRKARVEFPALANEVFEGYVETISPVIENKTCKVSILVENSNRKIKTGMFSTAYIDSKIYEDRLLVPKEAVTDRSGRPVIFIIREGNARWNYVTLGLQNNDYIEILSSEQEILYPGDLVITSGHLNLGHDNAVRISNPITTEIKK